MTQSYILRENRGIVAILAVVAAVAAWVLFAGKAKPQEWNRASETTVRRPTGFPQLVSQEPLPGMDGMMCQWEPVSASATLLAALRQEQTAAGTAARAGDAVVEQEHDRGQSRRQTRQRQAPPGPQQRRCAP